MSACRSIGECAGSPSCRDDSCITTGRAAWCRRPGRCIRPVISQIGNVLKRVPQRLFRFTQAGPRHASIGESPDHFIDQYGLLRLGPDLCVLKPENLQILDDAVIDVGRIACYQLRRHIDMRNDWSSRRMVWLVLRCGLRRRGWALRWGASGRTILG